MGNTQINIGVDAPGLGGVVMKYINQYGNIYTVKDAVLEADLQLLLDWRLCYIIVYSIKAVEPVRPGINSDFDLLITYLAEQVTRDKKLPSIAVYYKEVVVYSTNDRIVKGGRFGSVDYDDGDPDPAEEWQGSRWRTPFHLIYILLTETELYRYLWLVPALAVIASIIYLIIHAH